jgi:preprotein translocase subunit SecF
MSARSSENDGNISTWAKFICAVGVCAVILSTCWLLYRDQNYGVESTGQTDIKSTGQTGEMGDKVNGQDPRTSNTAGVFSAVEIL